MRLLFAFILYFYIADCKDFRSDYNFHSEINGWLKLHQIPATFHDAWLRCRLEGAVLASPSYTCIESAMQEEMTNRSVSTGGIFTGIHATFSKGDFFSMEGIPLDVMQLKWMPNEPDNKNNDEECILYNKNNEIADIKCSEIHPYFCYKKNSSDLFVTECGTVDKEYNFDTRTGKCYKFHKQVQTWSRAFMTCSAEGGHLAIINSATEVDILKELFAKNPSQSIISALPITSREVIHIGFHDWNEKGIWNTIHGTSLVEAGFEIWAPSQPDNENSHCGAMFRNGTLDDVYCLTYATFICEKSPNLVSHSYF